MRTIQMTLDDNLVQSVDKVVKELKTTRSAFTRNALRDAINNFSISRLEEEQNWGDE
jgi:metal-responsive CopG/Arc/MetJ family transcriptional regulator